MFRVSQVFGVYVAEPTLSRLECNQSENLVIFVVLAIVLMLGKSQTFHRAVQHVESALLIEKFELNLLRTKCLKENLLVLLQLTGFVIPVWTYHHNISSRLHNLIINHKGTHEVITPTPLYPNPTFAHQYNIKCTRFKSTFF